MRPSSPVVAALGLLAAACGGPQPPPFRPVADNKLLMQSVIDPAADVIWESVGTIITADGTEERRPRSPEEWTIVRNSAVTLAESGNLLMMVPRAVDGDGWMKDAQALVDAGTAAMRAAEAKDADDLFTVGGQIYETCASCHRTYVPSLSDVRVER